MGFQDNETRLPLKGRYESLPQVFLAAGEQFAEREAYVDGSRHYTFGQWSDDASRLAGKLAETGVKQGDVVAIWLVSSIEFAIAIGAVALLGAVATGINPRLGSREVSSIRALARPRAWIAEDDLRLAEDLTDEIWIDRSQLSAMLRDSKPRPLPPVEVTPDAPAIIVWTSGTTGMPKGAWYDHRNMEAAVALAGAMTEPFDRRLAPPVFGHAGYLAKIWEQCAFGLTLIVPPTPWKAATALRLMVDEKVTAAAGVPTQWEKLLAEPGIAQADLSSLRICIVSSAPMSASTIEALRRELKTKVLIRYAMSECPTIAGTSPEDDLETLCTTVGRALSDVEIDIRDDANQPLKAGEIGRIVVNAPCRMRGYWNAPDETMAAFTPDGWLVTGDLGHLDAQGRLVLAGRTSDMYIRGGYNIYPTEVENVLLEHPRVEQVAVTGMMAPTIGEIGVAFVVPVDPREPPTLEDLRAWSRERLADYKAPDRLEIVGSLPLTTMMKINKAELRRRFQAA